VVVTGGSTTVREGALGITTCIRRAMVRFSGNPQQPQGVEPGDLMSALGKVVEDARSARSSIFNEFRSLYGFEPGDITLAGNEVMLNTLFDLNVFPKVKDEVEKLFKPIVPSGSPVMLGVGILCGGINEPVFSYDSNEEILVLGLPHDFQGGNCLRHALIKY
jgi:hypothetical protein